MRLLLLSAFFVLCAMSVAQEGQPAEPWFTVAVSTSKEVVAVGSDVKLKVVLVNATKKDIFYGAGGQREVVPFSI